MNLNENSNDLERIKRIMHSKKITIDINTRSSLDEEQIKKIKSIFQANPQLKKLPRLSLIESKIQLIQNALQKNSASIHKLSLTRMLYHYTKLKKILNDMELDLPYSM